MSASGGWVTATGWAEARRRTAGRWRVKTEVFFKEECGDIKAGVVGVGSSGG